MHHFHPPAWAEPTAARDLHRRSDTCYLTLAIQPMFLFSATFYPLWAYPESLRRIGVNPASQARGWR